MSTDTVPRLANKVPEVVLWFWVIKILCTTVGESLADSTSELLAATRHETAQTATQFRVVVPNPARAEIHLLHPERHDKAAAAEQVLRATLPELERAAAGHVVGSVSVQHDPMDTLEHVLHAEPIDEIMLAVHEHALTIRLHQGLQHRLGHLGIPVTVIGHHASCAGR